MSSPQQMLHREQPQPEQVPQVQEERKFCGGGGAPKVWGYSSSSSSSITCRNDPENPGQQICKKITRQNYFDPVTGKQQLRNSESEEYRQSAGGFGGSLFSSLSSGGGDSGNFHGRNFENEYRPSVIERFSTSSSKYSSSNTQTNITKVHFILHRINRVLLATAQMAKWEVLMEFDHNLGREDIFDELEREFLGKFAGAAYQSRMPFENHQQNSRFDVFDDPRSFAQSQQKNHTSNGQFPNQSGNQRHNNFNQNSMSQKQSNENLNNDFKINQTVNPLQGIKFSGKIYDV
ncbi:UNKNOWN [Stylonychia lemnae]|uniref:Uncharacterized protein n=1 Tax=Stylonychia lemnae TaxID=5949 RepID=A0A078A332_STYLE|nr:UNKNOWN [Stylonychia lemnae]|eukprot:CDW76688.1 UNKNOWN [Stylonychia lemnae]